MKTEENLKKWKDHETNMMREALQREKLIEKLRGTVSKVAAATGGCMQLVVSTTPLTRTVKLCAALSDPGCQIVHSGWLTACEQAARFVDAKPYLLHGEYSGGGKVEWSFDADESRRRAEAGPCLAGLSFLVANGCAPDLSLVIGNAGGEVVKRAGAGTIVVVKEEKDASKHKGKKAVLQDKVMSAVMKQEKKELGL